MNNSIFKTFFLSLCIMANMHFAYGQTASILPQAKTQFTDQNGKPLTSGTVDFYIPSTSTRKTTWQNSGETVANSNPVVLDSAGRAIIWGDGTYRQVVKDRNGNIIWDQVTSSAAGGSSGPTIIGDGDAVGTIKPWAGMTAPSQYAFTYGQELVRATYPALFTAITSSQPIFCTSGSAVLSGLSDTTNFWIGMTVETSCVVAGSSTIISKTSTSVTLAANSNVTTNSTGVFFPWGHGNGVTTFNLPDFRGLVLAGNNNMGGVASSTLTTTYFGATNPNSIGAAGGNQFGTLSTPNLPAYTPSGSIVSTSTVTYSGFNISGGVVNVASLQGNTPTPDGAKVITTSTFTGVAQGGTSTPFSLIQPTKTVNYIIKVTPDVVNPIFGITNIIVNTTTVSSGTDRGLLFDNAGVLGDTVTTTNPRPLINGTLTIHPTAGNLGVVLSSPSAVANVNAAPSTLGLISAGSAGTPITTSVPTIGISRYEAISGNTAGGQSGALYIDLVSNNTTVNSQGIGLTVNSQQFGTGDIVGAFMYANMFGTSNVAAYPGIARAAAYGLFVGATANASGRVPDNVAIALNPVIQNNTGIDTPYINSAPGNFAVMAQALGPNLSMAGFVNQASGAQFDAGFANNTGSVKTYAFIDGSSSVTVLRSSTAHTNGVDFTSAGFTGFAWLSTGASIDPAGAAVFTSVSSPIYKSATAPTAVSGAGPILIGSASTINSRMKVNLNGVDYWIPASTSAF